MKKDLEVIEDIIINTIKLYLPDKITQINNDKNDGLLITDIEQEAYFDTLESKIANYPNFIFYGYDDIVATGIGQATKQDFSMFIVVYLSGLNRDGSENRKRAMRYSRAIKEVLQTHSHDWGIISTLTISDIIPQDFSFNENSPLYKVGGVEIGASYA